MPPAPGLELGVPARDDSGDDGDGLQAFRPGITRANNAILGLFGTPAGNVTVTSGFAVGNANLVIDVTGLWRQGGLDPRRTMSPCANFQ